MHRIGELYKLLTYWRAHPIASRSLLQTVMRFVRWQAGSRLLGRPVLCPWLKDSRLLVEKGMTGATMNLYCGLHEFHEMGFLLHFLRPEDKFVDIGANVGVYTVLASKVVGAETMCVEPVPDTYGKLLENLRINAIESRVEALCCAVGCEADGTHLRFTADLDTTNRVAPPNYEGATVEVPIQSMDKLVPTFSAALWKVDVEGFEESLLKGAGNALAEEKLKAIEIEGDGPEVSRILQSHGFKKVQYDPVKRELHRGPGSRMAHNCLWIRDFAFVAERCRAAPVFSVLDFSF